MAKQLKHFTTALCLLVITTSAYCAHSKNVLVNANNLKNTGFRDGKMGTVNVDWTVMETKILLNILFQVQHHLALVNS